MSTYRKAIQFIKNATSTEKFYQTIREILSENERNYPEDYQIKELQRLADAKYEELGGC